MSTTLAKSCATQAQQAGSAEAKLDFIAKAIYELAKVIEVIERRVR
jgi:hypothetical protein